MKKKEENGSTSPARAYKVKKMNSSYHKSLGEMASHRILPSYPDDCQLSSSLSFLRSLSDQKREVVRMDVIAAGGGWDLEGGGELKNE
jgi:hypothetical protein